MFLLVLLAMTSCSITKQATKNKSEKEIETQSQTKTQAHIRDYSIINLDNQTLELSPVDISKEIQLLTAKDTIKFQNATAKISNTKSEKKNNITLTNNTVEKKEVAEQESTVNKTKDKEEEIVSDTMVLYIVAGIVVIAMLGQLLLYRSINKNTTAITEILKKLNG